MMDSGIRLRLWALAAAVALTSLTAIAQESFRGEATVNVVEVPVRVVDPETGLAVRGLDRDDFRVLEGREVQEISNFSEIAVATVLGEPITPAEAAVSDLPKDQEADERPLEVVYFFDLFLGMKGDKVKATRALRDRYRSEVPENEEVSVVAYDGNLEVLLEGGDDNFDVLDVLDEVEEIEARGIQQYISFTNALSEGAVSGERNSDFYERRQRSEQYFNEMEKRVQRVGSALSATMARFATADARRVLVAFTPGYPASNWSPTYAPVDLINASARYPAQGLWRDVALEAADLGFTLYLVDSSGLRTSNVRDAEMGISDVAMDEIQDAQAAANLPESAFGDPVATDADRLSAAPGTDSSQLGGWMERTRKNLLITTAETTGGSAHFDEDVPAVLTEVSSALGHYYSLAYTIEHMGDGQVYDITVELPGHPGYTVTHRTEYVDQPTSTRQAQRLRSAMLFGGDANPLGIRVELGEQDERFRLGAVGSKRVQVPFHIKIPYARIDMISRGDLQWGKVLITFFNEDQEGNQSQLASHEQPITVDTDRYEEAVAKGYFSYKSTVEIEGGGQKVYVGVQDLIGGRISIMPHDFDF